MNKEAAKQLVEERYLTDLEEWAAVRQYLYTEYGLPPEPASYIAADIMKIHDGRRRR